MPLVLPCFCSPLVTSGSCPYALWEFLSLGVKGCGTNTPLLRFFGCHERLELFTYIVSFTPPRPISIIIASLGGSPIDFFLPDLRLLLRLPAPCFRLPDKPLFPSLVHSLSEKLLFIVRGVPRHSRFDSRPSTIVFCKFVLHPPRGNAVTPPGVPLTEVTKNVSLFFPLPTSTCFLA